MSNWAVDFVHKMNNMAGPIAPWVTLVKRELGAETRQNPKVIQHLDRIARDAALILREAHELREPTTKPENVDMEELIGSIVGQVEMTASPGITIEFEHDELELPTVYTVKRQLSNAIYGVIHNAARAIMGEGEISIRLSRDKSEIAREECIRIEISDTGCGIPADRLDSVFEYGTSHWPEGKGIGYGLWRARSIIRSIGGNIAVTKSVPGAGSTFTIVLPTEKAGAGTARDSD
jgi:signal transduction histidine kinase